MCSLTLCLQLESCAGLGPIILMYASYGEAAADWLLCNGSIFCRQACMQLNQPCGCMYCRVQALACLVDLVGCSCSGMLLGTSEWCMRCGCSLQAAYALRTNHMECHNSCDNMHLALSTVWTESCHSQCGTPYV